MASQIRGGALTIAVLLLASSCLASAATNDAHISSVLVVGTVFCDTCFRQEFSKNSYFIKGAPVTVECETQKEGPNFRIEAKTNEHGEFEVEVPAFVFHSEKCSATLLQKEGPCRVASMANASSFTLKSKQGGIHTYSAGVFTYRPQIMPSACSNEVANPNSKSNEIEVTRRSEFESSKQIGLPPPSLLPPFVFPPISQLPPFVFPPIPGLTPSPIPGLTPSTPLPSFGLPPLPVLVSPPPSIIPPIGNLPNPPLLPIPPIPFIPPAQHTVKSHPTQP